MGQTVIGMRAEVGEVLVDGGDEGPVVVVHVFLPDAGAVGPHPERKLHETSMATDHGTPHPDDLAAEQRRMWRWS